MCWRLNGRGSPPLQGGAGWGWFEIAAGRAIALHHRAGRGQQPGLQRSGHGIGDGVLQREQILVGFVVALRPHDVAVAGVDERRGAAHLVAFALHRTFKKMRDAEQFADVRTGVLAVANWNAELRLMTFRPAN